MEKSLATGLSDMYKVLCDAAGMEPKNSAGWDDDRYREEIWQMEGTFAKRESQNRSKVEAVGSGASFTGLQVLPPPFTGFQGTPSPDVTTPPEWELRLMKHDISFLRYLGKDLNSVSPYSYFTPLCQAVNWVNVEGVAALLACSAESVVLDINKGSGFKTVLGWTPLALAIAHSKGMHTVDQQSKMGKLVSIVKLLCGSPRLNVNTISKSRELLFVEASDPTLRNLILSHSSFDCNIATVGKNIEVVVNGMAVCVPKTAFSWACAIGDVESIKAMLGGPRKVVRHWECIEVASLQTIAPRKLMLDALHVAKYGKIPGYLPMHHADGNALFNLLASGCTLPVEVQQWPPATTALCEVKAKLKRALNSSVYETCTQAQILEFLKICAERSGMILETFNQMITEIWDHNNGIRYNMPQLTGIDTNVTGIIFVTHPSCVRPTTTGLVLCIGNEHYANANDHLPFVIEETEELAGVFRKMDCEVILQKNLTAREIVLQIESLATLLRDTPNKYSFVVVHFSGHGSKDSVIGKDGQEVFIHDLETHLDNDRLPLFENKPRFLFWDICRTGLHRRGQESHALANFIWYYAAFDGQYAHVHREYSFTRILARMLAYSRDRDFYRIQTKVNAIVSVQMNQQPKLQSSVNIPSLRLPEVRLSEAERNNLARQIALARKPLLVRDLGKVLNTVDFQNFSPERQAQVLAEFKAGGLSDEDIEQVRKNRK
jgi:hypothetical protein